MAKGNYIIFNSKEQLKDLEPGQVIYYSDSNSNNMWPELIYHGDNRYSYYHTPDQQEMFTDRFWKQLAQSSLRFYFETQPNSLKFIKD